MSNASLITNCSTGNYNANCSLSLMQMFMASFSPTVFEWFVLIISFFIFVVGILGNALVVLVVAKNAHMRTITNMFIVNLAVGDFLVILICLPPSILNDVTKNWWFGPVMCKLIIYVQVHF
jgi:hypothetical protein